MKLPETTEQLDEVQHTALLLGAFASHVMSYDGGQTLRVIEESGLTLSQLKIMLELGVYRSEEGCCHLSGVAEGLGLSVSSVSRAVDSLVKAGLVTRVEDAEDRRRRNIELTESGRRVVNRILSGRVSGFLRFSESLTPEQRRAFEEAIETVMDEEQLQRTYRSIKEAQPE